MRLPVATLILGSVIGIAIAAAVTPPTRHAAPTLTVQRAMPPVLTPAAFEAPPAETTDGDAVAKPHKPTLINPFGTRDQLNDQAAQADALMSCGLIDAGTYQANGEEQGFREMREHRISSADIRADRAYIAAERQTLMLGGCEQMRTKPWALAWTPLLPYGAPAYRSR